MIIKELIEKLSKFPKHTTVWFSNDEEGNTLHAKADITLTAGLYEKEPEKTDVVIYPIYTANDIN